MRIELHCHSTRSDGSESPSRMGQWCRDRQVSLFALTDHDSTRGCDEARTAFGDDGFVRAVELSCTDEGRTVHLLVFDVARDQRWTGLEDQLTASRIARRARLRRIAARLEQAGMAIEVEPLLDQAEHRAVGRPDLARALVEAGFVRNLREAFDRYLGDGRPFDEPAARLSVAEGVDLARSAGARVSLAHPHTLDSRAEPLLREHRAGGLGGVEVFYGPYGKRQRAGYLDLARGLDLTPTGGSDYHGAALPQIERPGVDVDDAVGQRLCDWLEVAPAA